MLMMKSVRTAAPGTVKVAEIQRPAPGPRDLLVRVRACGICGTDAAFVQWEACRWARKDRRHPSRSGTSRPARSSR
jgi:threonine dehydrogenase-like Zn-dependent dehydrogenase